jgi:thiol-disulfide isomerase/thioredoxin
MVGWAAVLAAAFVVAEGVRAGDAPRKREDALPTARADSIRNFELKGLDGKTLALADLRDARVVVLAWTAPGCPVSMVYAPRIAALAKEYAPRGVRFVGMDSNLDEDLGELAAHVKAAAWDFPVLLDADGAVAQRLGAATTTAVVLLDANRRVRYRGAVDDQYDVGGRREKVAHAWLVDALEAVLSNQRVATEATEAPGCPLTFARPEAAVPPDAPTWSGDVAAIVHRRCTACHQPHQGGPFSLRTYEDARSRTATLRAAIADDRMPPWHAAGAKGTWANDRRLDPEEKRALLSWIDGGAPAGDPAKAPAPPPVPSKDAWDIGAPDAVFTFAKAQPVPAEGVVPYRFIEVPTSFDEDRWVSALEVRPGAPDVVHHVLVAALPPSQKKVRRAAFAPHNGFFAAMVPGARGMRYPDGTAKRLPKGSTLLFQMHYTPNGVAQEDLTSIGFVFAKQKPEREVFTAGAFAIKLEIPPGDPKYVANAVLPVPWDVRVLTFMPHMHVRGTSFRFAAARLGEPEKVLCDVPRYDFNWQTPYRLATPVAIPRGSFLHCVATFDNSEGNPYNPDPTATVRWGDQTWDEMMIGYVDYVRDS